MSRPTIPEVVERFAAYYRQHTAWGSLHIVMEDGNVEDEWVSFCGREAKRIGDRQGLELAIILATMTKSQRGRLLAKVRRHISG